MRWKAIGPGLLFAGAAVGVSHLVQSTRAGAGYGLALVIIVIAANILKYPAFSFGPRYAAATGCSLLEGYRRQGRWALWLYGALTLGTMFTVQAAVTFMTAGLVLAFTKAAIDPVIVTAAILALCVGILALGDYRWLDRIMKVVVAVLTVLTVAAALLVLPKVDWGTLSVVPEGVGTDMETVFFVAALVGWMPSAIDISVWHSLWSLARRRDTGYRPTVSDALFDFNVGYLGTAVLALCFVVLGAGVVYGSGREIPGSAGAFAAMVLDLYGQALGDWSRPLFGVTALMVMFSTTLTVVDGFPRAISALVARFGGAEDPERMDDVIDRRSYWIAALVLALGTIVIVTVIRKQLLLLVDIATVLSFMTAPLLAWLNHRAVFTAASPPGPKMRVFSLVAIAGLAAFALYYAYLRILS